MQNPNSTKFQNLKIRPKKNKIKLIIIFVNLGENELEEQITVIEDENEEVYDSNGRPLFGLKALQATTEEDTMPAQTAQLRELVEKHQQYARMYKYSVCNSKFNLMFIRLYDFHTCN